MCDISAHSCSSFTSSTALAQQPNAYPYNCSAVDQNTQSTVFDWNSATCNNLTAVAGINVVGDTTEYYRGSVCLPLLLNYADNFSIHTAGETCKGLVDHIFIPDAILVNASLSLLLPSYRMQDVLEERVSAISANLPKTIGAACQKSLYKIACGSAFYKVGTYNLSGTNVTVPRFPYQNNCLEYHKTCAFVIGLAPALDFNCSATAILPGNIVADRFPAGKQLVAKVVATVASTTYTLPVYSYPYDVTEMSDPNVTVECPRGFSEVADSTADGVVAGTGEFTRLVYLMIILMY